MRNVAIYAGSVLLGENFKQLNEVKFDSAPVLKAYTMADGSPLIYTAPLAKKTTEIVLECTQAEARILSQYASGAEFSFTGVNIVGNANLSAPIVCYLTGAVSVELVSEPMDKCTVRMAVQVVSGV